MCIGPALWRRVQRRTVKKGPRNAKLRRRPTHLCAVAARASRPARFGQRCRPASAPGCRALAALVHGAHQAGLFHVLDQPRGAVVADLQVALHQRDAGLAVLQHDLDRLVVQRVLLAAAVAVAEAALLAIHRAAPSSAPISVGSAHWLLRYSTTRCTSSSLTKAPCGCGKPVPLGM